MDLPFFRCPECGGGEVTVTSGNEFEVESIEVEEVQCIGPR
jgi:Zn finger protein HypA/HybF involved in hydrogenase expression